jgi:predicted nucleic acid-binding protein
LEASFGRLVQEDLEKRIADFDATAAHEAAALAAARQKAGRHVDLRDTQIAGNCIGASRNARYTQRQALSRSEDHSDRPLEGLRRVDGLPKTSTSVTNSW